MVLTGLLKNFAINEIKDRLTLLIDTMQEAIIRVVNDQNEDFEEQVESFNDNIITVITGNTINVEIDKLFDAYDLVGDDARARYNLAKEVFSFGENETNITTNTDQTKALNLINIDAQVYALTIAYDNAANITYDNKEDLQVVLDELEAEYVKVIKNTLLDTDTRENLVAMRTETIQLLSALELRSINTVETAMIPSRVLSYQYYGSSELSDQIVNLNNAANTGFIEGSVQVLSTE